MAPIGRTSAAVPPAAFAHVDLLNGDRKVLNTFLPEQDS
jgi:hypothetical protein